MKVTAIVPTYNRPKALVLCLQSLALQSRLPDEVVIADDGSGAETRDTIEAFRTAPNCPFEIRHVWQEDDGFRKPRILNESVRQATGDYLAFIDGDCLAHRDWLHHHVRLAEPNAMLGGKRVDLGPRLTEAFTSQGRLVNTAGLGLLLDSLRKGGSRKVEEGLVVSSPLLRSLAKMDRITDDGIWGCNFSVHKELFYRINGCDEDFKDGSIEDNDLGIRVLNSGGKLKSVRFLANVFHLWHNSSWSFTSDKYLENRRIMQQRIELKEPRCRNGITKE
ncbi:glycosyltransferase family 2 protein [Geomonas agri]|uniref:glycosyltransferase family 2 protein n=1 Tax=Geomonas agri TaxID=2873702 RepID=UPI001CD6FCEF|nr:glycosyltransferase family 2 protein [Geomonas agri]